MKNALVSKRTSATRPNPEKHPCNLSENRSCAIQCLVYQAIVNDGQMMFPHRIIGEVLGITELSRLIEATGNPLRVILDVYKYHIL